MLFTPALSYIAGYWNNTTHNFNWTVLVRVKCHLYSQIIFVPLIPYWSLRFGFKNSIWKLPLCRVFKKKLATQKKLAELDNGCLRRASSYLSVLDCIATETAVLYIYPIYTVCFRIMSVGAFAFCQSRYNECSNILITLLEAYDPIKKSFCKDGG